MTLAEPNQHQLSSLTGRTDLLVDAVARAVSAATGTQIDPGPADVQADPLELVPGEPAWAAAAEGTGDVAAVSVLLTHDVADALGATDPSGAAWTTAVDTVLESWSRSFGESVGPMTPPTPAEAVGALLPTAGGYDLVAGGLFQGDRHVGTVALVGRPPQAAHGHVPVGAQDAAPAGAPATVPSATTFAPGPLQALAEVQMSVTAELGRCRMSVQELLGLVPGAVVELDRSAGSPIDLLVNGTLIARGEVVVVDEEFGVRLTEIVGPED
jgi:flagellar motor switch protein FliN/FliY